MEEFISEFSPKEKSLKDSHSKNCIPILAQNSQKDTKNGTFFSWGSQISTETKCKSCGARAVGCCRSAGGPPRSAVAASKREQALPVRLQRETWSFGPMIQVNKCATSLRFYRLSKLNENENSYKKNENSKIIWKWKWKWKWFEHPPIVFENYRIFGYSIVFYR